MKEKIYSLEEKLADIDKRIITLENRVKEIEKKISNKNLLEKIKKKNKLSIINLLFLLREEGFFDRPKSLSEIVKELEKKGYFYTQQSLTNPLGRAVKKGFLGRRKINKKNHYVKR